MTVTVLQVLSWEARAECARCDRFVLRVVSEGAALDAARGGNPRDAVRSIVLRDALAEGFRRVRVNGAEVLLCSDCMSARRSDGLARAAAHRGVGGSS